MSVEQAANPYPGLRPFELEEDYLFFGREGQSEDILSRLRRNRLVAVVGTSGSGKSSLIRAGLLPYIFGGFMKDAGSHWRVAVMRPGGDPIRNLARELNDPSVLGDPAAGEDDVAQNATLLEVTLRRSGLGLMEAVRQAHLPPMDNVLIVVDQFEELFRYAETATAVRKEDDAAAFVKLLLEAASQAELPIYVALTMRSDFIGDCARFRDLPEAVTGGLYLIPRMSRDQRREAIERPARVVGTEISRRLVNKLLNDGGDNPDLLPIMQHALMRTWDYWSQTHGDSTAPIDIDDYKAIGEMAGALSRHAEEAYAELPTDRDRAIAQRLFQALTEKGDDNREIRRPTSVATVAAIADATPAEVISVIEYFRRPGRSFLTPPAGVALSGESMIDISHESLIRGWTRLDEWVNQERESVEVYQRLAETAALNAQGRAGLWSDPDLSYALNWRAKERPNAEWGACYHSGFDVAMNFLERSAKYRLRRRVTTGAIAAAVVVCLAFLANRLVQAKVEQAKVVASVEATAQAHAADEIKLAQAQSDAIRLQQQQAEEEKVKDADEKSLQSQQETEWVRDVAQTGAAERLDTASTVDTLSSTLTDVVPTGQKIGLELERAHALSKTGQHEEAARAYTEALKLHPDQPILRAERGTAYTLLGRGEDARADFAAYLESDPNNYLERSNLGIALGMLKRYDEAIAQMELSIKDFQFSSDRMYDSEVSPDIKRATGLTILETTPVIFHVACYYEIANLRAFAGDPGFIKALERADQAARQQGFNVPSHGSPVNASNRSVDPFLVAIEWGWLDARASTGRDDYGIYASYGALWERASQVQPRFKDWAGHFYATFQQIHARKRDRRYNAMAAWVAGRLRVLYPGTGSAPPVPPEDRTGIPALQTQASLLESQKDYQGAVAVLTDAIRQVEHQPLGRAQIVSLLLERGQDYYLLSNTINDSKSSDQTRQLARADYVRVLQLQPRTGYAHAYLAATDAQADPATRQKEYELALQYDPQLAWVRTELAGLVAAKDPKRAIALLQQANRIDTPTDDKYQQIATLQIKIGDYQSALHSIDQAIALSPEKLLYYDIKDTAEKGLGRDSADRALDKSSAYRVQADSVARAGKPQQALTLYLQALHILADEPAGKGNPGVRAEELVEARGVSQMLEKISSRKDAKQFWMTAGSTPYLQPIAEIAQEEIRRLSTP